MFELKEINDDEILYQFKNDYNYDDYDKDQEYNNIKPFIVITAIATFTSFAILQFSRCMKYY
jgi:predicted KAP-like P-loop ATPase